MHGKSRGGMCDWASLPLLCRVSLSLHTRQAVMGSGKEKTRTRAPVCCARGQFRAQGGRACGVVWESTGPGNGRGLSTGW